MQRRNYYQGPQSYNNYYRDSQYYSNYSYPSGFNSRKNKTSKNGGRAYNRYDKLAKNFDKINQNEMTIPEHTVNLINDLLSNKAECMICNDVIKKDYAIWSCSTCWTIFHLECIKEWIKKKNKRRYKNEWK